MNWIIKDVLGINFFYFKAFTLVEQEELLFARLTPGFNISWAIDGTLPVTPMSPYMLDLTGLERIINEIGLP